VKIRQRRACQARTEEQANIVQASFRVPGCQKRLRSCVGGRRSLCAVALYRNDRGPRAKILTRFAEPSAVLGFAAFSLSTLHRQVSRSTAFLEEKQRRKWLLCVQQSENAVGKFVATIKLYVLHDESGTQRPLQPCLNHSLTLSARNLTQELGANKTAGQVLPVRLFVLRGLIWPGQTRRARRSTQWRLYPGSRRSKCTPEACDGC
jgi:hypothetical protein